MWYYINSEPNLWTVGHSDHGGRWTADSDHDSREAAAARVAFLNGEPDARVDRLTAERDDLRRQLAEAGNYLAANINLHSIVIAQGNVEPSLRRQLAEVQRWQPLPDGLVSVLENSDAGLEIDGTRLHVLDEDGIVISAILPDNLRLCHSDRGQHD